MRRPRPYCRLSCTARWRPAAWEARAAPLPRPRALGPFGAASGAQQSRSQSAQRARFVCSRRSCAQPCAQPRGGRAAFAHAACALLLRRHGRRRLHVPRVHHQESDAGEMHRGVCAPLCGCADAALLWSPQPSKAQGGARAGTYAYRGPFDALSTIVRKASARAPRCSGLGAEAAWPTQEGWRTLFKGFSTVLPVAPAQALYMGGYQSFRRLQPGDPDSPAVQFGACTPACVLLLCCSLTRRCGSWWHRGHAHAIHCHGSAGGAHPSR